MAKLNKNEIEAVANKAFRALTDAAEKSREQLMKDYKPSESYSRIIELAKKRDEANKVYHESKEEIADLMRTKYGIYCCSSDPIEYLRNAILKKECGLRTVPSKESIIDDVTIAAIDKNFDTTAFIEKLVAKFNS